MKLSLVVPCYNEQDNVRAFYDAAVNAFLGCGYEYELVMVNDGSRDNTGIELKKLFYEKREETPITIVQFSRNFGKEAAILAGMKHAKGDLVTLIDADLQQRPEIVREMVQILDEHPEYDCVAAFQKERNEGRGLSFFKREFYRLINQMSEVEFVNGASDFRTCRRKMVDAILSMFFRGLALILTIFLMLPRSVMQERQSGASGNCLSMRLRVSLAIQLHR